MHLHPDLHLALHRQRQRELDQALAVALLVRERTTPAPRLPRSSARDLVGVVAQARRRIGAAVRQPVGVGADRSPAACCAA